MGLLKIAKVLMLASGPVVCVWGLYLFALGRGFMPPPNADLYAPWSTSALILISVIGALNFAVGAMGIVLALRKEKNSAPRTESKIVEFRQPRRRRRDRNRRAG